jgi:hypothetical protein
VTILSLAANMLRLALAVVKVTIHNWAVKLGVSHRVDLYNWVHVPFADFPCGCMLSQPSQ